MRKELKDIRPGQGLGLLKFGMTRHQVRMLLGEPDEMDALVYNEEGSDEVDALVYNEEGSDAGEAWHYDTLELSVSFDRHADWKLVSMAVSSPEYTFNGTPLIQLNKTELLRQLKMLGISDLDQEDLSTSDAPNYHLLSSEGLCINFFLEEDKLSEIQWSPLFEEDDTIIWPELN